MGLRLRKCVLATLLCAAGTSLWGCRGEVESAKYVEATQTQTTVVPESGDTEAGAGLGPQEPKESAENVGKDTDSNQGKRKAARTTQEPMESRMSHAGKTAPASSVGQIESGLTDSEGNSPVPADPITSPVSAVRAFSVLDLREFKLHRPEEITVRQNLELTYSCRSGLTEALEHHLQLLTQLGWKELQNVGSFDSGEYLNRQMVKDGLLLEIAIHGIDQERSSVSLRHLGNIDARTLPMHDAAAQQPEYSSAWAASYQTKLPVSKIAEYCHQAMSSQGWMEYSSQAAISELPYESEDSRVIPYVQNGVTCYLLVSPPSKYTDGQTAPAYFLTGLIADGVCVPTGAQQVELDRQGGRVSYAIDQSLSTTQDRIERQYESQGWNVERKQVTNTKKKGRSVLTRDAGDLTLLIQLSEVGFSNTKVEVESFTRASSNSQVAGGNGSLEAGGSAVQPEQQTTTPSSGILVDKFPKPDGKEYQSLDQPLMLSIDWSPDQLAKFYDQAMMKHEFRRNTEASQKLEDGALSLVYTRGNLQVAIVVRESDGTGTPNVFVMGDGLTDQQPSNLPHHVDDRNPEDFDSLESVAAHPDTAENESTQEPEAKESAITEKQVLSDSALASKAANRVQGVVTLGSTSVNLDYAVAYQLRQGEQVRTVVLLTDRELPRQELLLQLTQSAEISLFDLNGRMPQYIEVSWDDDTQYCNLSVGSASVSGLGQKLDIQVEAQQGWVRGKISLKKPHRVFGDDLTFDAKLDIAALDPANLSMEMKAVGQLQLREVDGIAIPIGAEEVSRIGGAYTTTAQVQVNGAKVSELLDLYLQEMPALNWQESPRNEPADVSRLTFKNKQAELLISVREVGDEIELDIKRREIEKARKDGLLPAAGKGKLILGNAYTQEVVFRIGKRIQPLPAGKGSEDPKDAANFEVSPGAYEILIEVPGKDVQKESVQLEAGDTWGLIVLPSGECFVDQLL